MRRGHQLEQSEHRSEQIKMADSFSSLILNSSTCVPFSAIVLVLVLIVLVLVSLPCLLVSAPVSSTGHAAICLLSEHMTVIRQRIDVSIPRKRAGAASTHEKAMDKFFGQVYEGVMRHLDYKTLRAVVVASPGFTRENVSCAERGRRRATSRETTNELTAEEVEGGGSALQSSASEFFQRFTDCQSNSSLPCLPGKPGRHALCIAASSLFCPFSPAPVLRPRLSTSSSYLEQTTLTIPIEMDQSPFPYLARAWTCRGVERTGSIRVVARDEVCQGRVDA